MDSFRGGRGGFLSKDLRNRHRVAENNLRKKLDILKKAEQNELRMFQASNNRFQIKYSKFLSNGENSPIKHPKNDVNNFKRCTNEHSVRYTSPNKEQLYSQQLAHELVFTNDEVDIEKLLCLHLLTRHVVRPGTHLRSAGSTTSRQPATEQPALDLFNRKSSEKNESADGESRNGKQSSSAKENALCSGRTPHTSTTAHPINKLLPRYIINFLPRSEVRRHRQLVGSGSLTSSLCSLQWEALPANSSADLISSDSEAEDATIMTMFVNKELESLINTVIRILQEVNPLKMNDMIKLAKNPSALADIIKKPNIQSFLLSVEGKSITSSYSCFRKIYKKVFITACSPADRELPSRIVASSKHIISFNITFDENLNILRNVLTRVRRNIYKQKSFNKDVLLVTKPEEMDTINITRSYLKGTRSLLNWSNSIQFSATGTSITDMSADKSHAVKSTEMLMNIADKLPLSTSRLSSVISGATLSLSCGKHNVHESCNNPNGAGASSSKLQSHKSTKNYRDQSQRRACDRSSTPLMQGSSSTGTSLSGRSAIRASIFPERIVVKAGEMEKRDVHGTLSSMGSLQRAQSKRDEIQTKVRSIVGEQLEEQNARRPLVYQSRKHVSNQGPRDVPAQPMVTETVKFKGIDVSKLKVAVTDAETDKKFEQFLKRTSSLNA